MKPRSSGGWIFLLLTAVAVDFTSSHWTQHYRYASQPAGSSRWKKRQLFSGGGGSHQQEIELNVTVPYIFSARLYPYGVDKGDVVLDENTYSQAHVLRNELQFFEEKMSIIYVTRDGALAFSPDVVAVSKQRFPRGPKIIAPFWADASLGESGRVYFRETNDENLVKLASSEIQIQYRYPNTFRPKSVFVATWENLAPAGARRDLPNNVWMHYDQRNTFQVALILGKNGSFAHVIYSKLKWHNNATAGFNEGNGNSYYNLPGSGTFHVQRLANESDIGIPGEWLFKLDGQNVYLCGPGFQGMECIHKCDPGQWYYDCVRRCHCADSGVCNFETGHCPGQSVNCGRGWTHPPTCDIDIDECNERTPAKLCRNDSPDCINTPGSFICTCLAGFDNATNACKGSIEAAENTNSAIEIIPQQPNVVLVSLGTQRPQLVITQSQTSEAPFVFFLGNMTSSTSTASSAPSAVPIIQPTPTAASSSATANHALPTLDPTVVSERTSNCGRLKCGQHAHCVNESTCVCDAGWSGNGEFCVDVNECFSQTACPKGAHCENNPGNFSCKCDLGFELSASNECVDINECERGLQCPGGNLSVCINSHGSYECRCRPGFNGSPLSTVGCVDINECLIPNFYCGSNSECENSPGAFKCTCQQGFQLNSNGSGCVDIDECSLTRPCSPSGAVCTNTQGSFRCTCSAGYKGDGFFCSESSLMHTYDRLQDFKFPPRNNFVEQIVLSKAIRIFGKEFSSIFISSNGIITFDAALADYKSVPLPLLRTIAVAPLYKQIDVNRSSGIFVKEVTGIIMVTHAEDHFVQDIPPMPDFDELSRSSRSVQEHFNDPNFAADAVVVLSFDNVVAVDERSRANATTYQATLAWSKTATYVTFMYERITNDDAQAGITSPDESRTFELPGSGKNASALIRSSNVGVPGKWIYRVDLSQVIVCPAGRTDPPYCPGACASGSWGMNCSRSCQCAEHAVCNAITGDCPNAACLTGWIGRDCSTDINECAAKIHRCHANADCVNLFGGYSCSCKSGYTGDGIESCVETTPCSARGLTCAQDAKCVETLSTSSDHICVCNPGFYGDGLRCKSTTPSPTTTAEPTTTKAGRTTTKELTVLSTTSAVPFTTALKPTRVATKGTTEIHFETAPIDNSITSRWPAFYTDIKKPNRVTTIGNSVFGVDRSEALDSALDNKPRELTTPSSKDRHAIESNSPMLVIIIPAALCGVWLVLIIVVLVLCLRKKKRQREKYGLGYYVPSSNQTTPKQMSPVSYGNYYNSYYGSQWNGTIQRPTYDYYQGIYYPDPYAHWKY